MRSHSNSSRTPRTSPAPGQLACPDPAAHTWTSLPLSQACERVLTRTKYDQARAQVTAAIAAGHWAPVEDAVQAVVTAAAQLSRTRTVWLTRFFAAPSACPRCEAPAVLCWVARIADWVVRCSRAGCEHYEVPLSAQELKCAHTVGQWSRTSVAEWATAAHSDLILPQDGFILPAFQCTPDTCLGPDCTNPHQYSGHLAAPQLVRAAMLGARPHQLTPVVLLADTGRGTASQLYGTTEWSFELNPAVVTAVDLATQLTSTCAALTRLRTRLDRVGRPMTDEELAVNSAAVEAVWTRLPWDPFETTLTGPVLPWLSPASLAAARSALAARAARHVRTRR